MLSVIATEGHNLDTRATGITFAQDFLNTMSSRAGANQPLLQVNDEFWMVLKTTPGPGTNTGVGGYQTFYVPDGMQVTDVAYVLPDLSDPRGFHEIPMKGQSPIAIGNGSVSAKTTPELIGWSLPGFNGLNKKFDPVTPTGIDRGTIAGVYADTGIFYSTDPRTAYNSYGAAPTGGISPMTNNSGDTVGEYYASNVANSSTNEVLGTMTLWDSFQLRAYGRKDASPIIDPDDGRGNAPWGLGNAVAGPQSGYAWEFDYAAYQATVGSEADKIRAGIKIGPWQRIKYPGSQISSDQPGLISNALGYAGIDASSLGADPSALPAGITAVRFAIGQLELGRTEITAVKVKIASLVGNDDDCFPMFADAFGGDAGGTDGGKDHIWRYFDPTVVKLDACVSVQKVASKKLVAPNEIFYFDLTFINNGVTTIPNISLVDVIPSGLQYVSSTPSPFTVNGSTYTWKLGEVQPGSVESVRLYVKSTGSGTIFNTVTAKSGTNTVGVSTDSVEVGTRALLIKSKSVTPSFAAPGNTVEYTMKIENIGTGSSGTPMVIRDFLPPGFTYSGFVSATLNGAATSNPVISVNSSDTTQPVFTITQGIQRDKSLIIRFNSLIGAGVAPGVYPNQFDVTYEGKRLPPIPEAPVTVAGGKIGDTVYRDWNGNGAQDANELGISGVEVKLYASDGITLVATTTTDSNGNYYFPGLIGATYVVKVTAPSDHVQTGDPDATVDNQHTVVLANDQQYLTADFGYRPSGSGSIGDTVFEDVGNNGVFNPGTDTGISGVEVKLYVDQNGNGIVDPGTDVLLATTNTGGSGTYLFGGLATGFNYIAEVDNSDAALESHFGVSPYQTSTGVVKSVPNLTGSYLNADFGFWVVAPATIGDQLFLDADADGIFDAGETPLANVTVWLDTNGNGLMDIGEPQTTSGPDGKYFFNNLGPDTYTVRVNLSDPDIPGGFSPSVGLHTVNLTAGQIYLDADFPFVTVFSKVVDKASALPGDNLIYTLYPYWPGPAMGGAFTVNDVIPAGTTFVSASQGGLFVTPTPTPGVPGSYPGSSGSGSITLTASKDTGIDSTSPTLNYGTSASLIENRGGGDTLGTRQVLVQFDLSTVPSGVTLTGAQFKLTKTDTTNSNSLFQIYPLLKAWTEGTGGASGVAGAASFNQRVAGTYWGGGTTPFDKSAPSADFGGMLAATTVNGAGTYTWGAAALLSQVQSWYTTPANNFGLVMGSNARGTDDTVWNSRESAGTKPQLVLDYTGTASPATTTSISVSPSVVNGSGSTVTVTMTVTSTGAVSGISPTALSITPGSSGSNASLVSGPTGSPASIGAGGGSQSFTWTYHVTSGSGSDQVFFTGGATGSGATFGNGVSNGVLVNPSSDSATWNLGANSAAIPGSNPGTTSGSNSVTLNSIADNEIWSDQPDNNYGTLNTMWMERTNNYLNRLLIQFDLSTIPSNATITSGVMTLNRKSGNNNNPDIAAHRLTAAWTETTSTWNNRTTATPWAAPGGDGNYDPTATATTSVTANSFHNWTLTPLVQGWVSGTYANRGVLMRLTDQITNGQHEFRTREDGNSANWPQLAVSYTTPAIPATTTALSVSPYLVTDSGSGVNVNVSMTVTAAAAVSGITAPATLTVSGSNGASATKVSGPTNSPASIGLGGGSATFTWVYKVNAGSTPGQVTFSGAPTASGATFASGTSNGVLVTPPLTMTVSVNTPPGVTVVDNVAEYRNGPTLLATDNALTSLAGSIGDFVWADLDTDGVQDAGEQGIAGVDVLLYASDGTTLLDTVTTDAAGAYRFNGLSAGNYVVSYDQATQPANYLASTPVTVPVSLGADQQFNDADFGLYPAPSGTGSIGDYLWIDADIDGVQDAGELPLEGIGVTLERLVNGIWGVAGTATTNAAGAYSFTGLSAGSYRVTVDATSQVTSPYASGTFDLGTAMAPTYDRDGTGTPDTALVTLATNSSVVTDTDFGYNWSGSIGDYVWWDDNLNGIQDEAPERAIAGAQVLFFHDVDGDGEYSLLAGDYQIFDTVTDSNGAYLFANLPPGNYLVKVYDSSIAGEVVTTTDEVMAVTLTGGDAYLDADFGFSEVARVEANIFYDVNASGFNDGAEALLAGITVTLSGTDTLGNPILRTAVSTSTGDVVFLVPEGDYTISYNTGEAASLYPSLTTLTTNTSFNFTAVAGDEGIRHFEFGLDDSGAIGDTIFADQNGDGAKQAGEPDIAGITVNLYFDANGDGTIDFGAGDQLLDTAVTNGSGFYQFNGLPDTAGASRYVVEVLTSTVPSGYLATPTAFPAGAVPATSRYSTELTGGEVIDLVDFGYPLVPNTYYTVSGTIFHDNGDGSGVSGDGVINGTEAGIAGMQVLVEVDADNNGSYEGSFLVPVDGNGFYSVGGILEGADVRVTVVESTLPNPAYVQTGDPDGAPLSPIWNISNIMANETDIDFGYLETLGSISGTVVRGDGNGIAEVTEPAVDEVTVTLRYAGVDGILGTGDDVITGTTTAVDGSYSFASLLPGKYEVTTTVPSGLNSLADADGGSPNSINVTLTVGQDVLTRDFELEASAISGLVWNDLDADGLRESGEPLLQGVTVFLDLDNNGFLDFGEPTATTDSNGYYEFTGIPFGTYDVRIDPATLPSGSFASYDIDGIGTLNLGVVTVTPNQDITDIDFGYYQHGSITGSVLVGSDPLENVLLSLVDAAGDPVLDGMGSPITTLSGADGSYTFGDLPPGIYGVKETQPFGYVSVSDKDGGSDLDQIRPITVTSGAANTENDFIEALDDCPDNWAEWKFQHPGEVASGNPDTDAYDNLNEFAFAMDANSGAGDAFHIQPSVDPLRPGEIDAVFTRPVGAIDNVVYTLQYATTVGNPTVWASIVITPSMYDVVNNGDCTETITIKDLESLPEMDGGEGVIRIKTDLDEVPDSGVDWTSYTEVEGWKKTGFGICCQTYNNPYLSNTLFTGIVDAGGISGQVVDLSGSSGATDLGTLLSAPGATYYLEITDETGEGNRFDIVSATGSTVTLANDASLSAAGAPYNTVTGAPNGFEGSSVVIRRHWTLAEIFPPSEFVASTNQSLADEIQIHTGDPVTPWTILHLYDDSGTPRWVDNFNSLIDQGGLIIAPGQGLFFNNRNSAKNLLAYGEIRQNDFIRPLAAGSNLVGGGYPLDQSATDTGSRVMTLAQSFFGSKDFKTADSFFVWKGDATPGLSAYDSYYLLNGAPQSPSLIRWVKVGDATLLARDSAILLLENRAVFTRSAFGLPAYGYPAPWVPDPPTP